MTSVNPAVNYENFFVPAIGAPLANDLVRHAALSAGDRVLDVACGTGVVARLALVETGAGGTVAGLDVNPAMIDVARSTTPSGGSIDWHEANAEKMPLPDASFDVVLCQMGLQFMPGKLAALREMRRVLVPGGRLVLNVPGPTPRIMSVMEEALARQLGPDAAGFVNQVFSLHDEAEIQSLVDDAGFNDISVQSDTHALPLPPPKEFLWQYIQSTPLVAVVADLDDKRRSLMEHDIVTKWEEMKADGALMLRVRMVVVHARR